MTKTALIWFRQDLRLSDNPALLHACHEGYDIIPIYILDDENAGKHKRGAASKFWLHQSLKSLNQSFDNKIIFRNGDAREIIPALIEETGANAVFWNRCYEPWRIARDKIIKDGLKDNDIEIQSFNGSLLWEPWEVAKKDGTPYKVFTPYYRKGCLVVKTPESPQPAPKSMSFAAHSAALQSVDDLNLMPDINWHGGMEEFWEFGEAAAQKRLADFVEDGLAGYKDDRNRPDMNNVSRLSPYLHNGEVSSRQAWEAAHAAAHTHNVPERDVDHFCSELGWREFSYYLLYHWPEMTWKNLQTKFDKFPWIENETEELERWRRGKTGIPIVDAGMRQLWQTGWIHNRVRMVVASLLVKNLLTHWHRGEEWFWDTLVDADLANNSASWQWVAGSGADAAPYFRIFNPLTQGEKFDPNGEYVRKYVPELTHMPDKFLHKPWEAPDEIFQGAGIKRGVDYPNPIVDLKASRQRALDALATTKS